MNLSEPSKPLNLSAKPGDRGDLSLNIFWDQPEIGASCIQKYRVTLDTATYSFNHTVTRMANDTSIKIPRLYPCLAYTIQVNAVDNDNGDGNFARLVSDPTPMNGKLISNLCSIAKVMKRDETRF